ncbi:5-formyltetrahydrofolate cyclo-ligase [Cumulibacter soli]|uniref:5-formyltetrahydrofolate cyclo-ligase n=1 Tax=Cumulibacter soli TaxID=2546344 RepID=UPI0010671BD2|nr:5-formyltetrahydrofolate cyclo-ligase [Cumulibacter soli]
MSNAAQITLAKADARRYYLARRAVRSDYDRHRATAALAERARRSQRRIVAGFVPHGGEPGSLEVLDELSRRTTVLLPITGVAGEPLQWAAYGGRDTLVTGPHGILQPPEPDGHTLADVELVYVPAVAIGRDGTRLGHGGGYYDRTLTDVPTELLCGVVHDDEVADTLPTHEHDVRVGWLCTPSKTTRLLT